MIEIKLIKEDNFFKGLMVRNHANTDEFGKDLLCTSISTLSITLVNYLTDVLKIDYSDLNLYMIESKEFPLISINIEDKRIYEDVKVQAGFSYLEIGVESLIDEYKDFIDLIYQEV